MARVGLIQASFNGGEISPRLYGRSDIAPYTKSAAVVENFVPRPEGGLMRRHGTRYAGEVKDSSKVTRVVRFIYGAGGASSIQAYIIEFGHLYARFWKDYGQIISGTPVEIVTPYVEADLMTLMFAQSADVLFIDHNNYAPAQLTRQSHTSWTLSSTVFNKGPFATPNVDKTKGVMMNATKFLAGTTGVAIQSNSAIFNANQVNSYMYLEEVHFADNDVYPYTKSAANPTVGDQQSNDGNVYECVSQTGTNTGEIPPTHTEGDAWDNPVSSGKKTLWRYLHSRWGIVKITAVADSKNATVSFETYCPTGFNPATKTITNVSNAGGRFRITILAGHLFADDDQVNIASVVGSGGMTAAVNGDWKIIYVSSTQFDLDGSTFVGAYTSGGTARRYATYKYRFSAFSADRGYPAACGLHEQRLAHVGTQTQPFGFWASASSDYPNFLPGVKDADSIAQNIASNEVTSLFWLMSSSDLMLGSLAQEFAAFGGGLGDPLTPAVTRIVPQSNEGSSRIQPLRVAGDVIFVNRSGRKIFAIAYNSQANGYQALELTELVDHLALGLKWTQIAWAKNPCSLIWALRSDGVLCSLTYRRDQSVFAWARHPIDGVVEAIDVIPSSPDGAVDDLWMVVRRTINGVTKRYVEYLAAPFEPTSPTDKTSMGFLDCALSYAGAPTNVLSGLGHLEAKTVKVIVNGALHPDRTVAGGAITLDDGVMATTAWVGLAYTSKLKPLRLEGAAVGTAQGKTKRTARLTVRVANSLGGMIGPADESNLEELLKRDQGDLMDASPPLRSGDFDAVIATDYDLDGCWVILQSDPLPLDIACVMPLANVSEG